MKQLNLLTLFFLLCLGTAQAQVGLLSGKVTDEKGLVLPGANIVLNSSTSLGTITDENGAYFLIDVPTGAQTLTISYIGYTTSTIEVEIVEDEMTIQHVTLSPGIMLGEEVIIVGDNLQGQAKALNQQKNSMNITNVVSSDQIGRFPDANIGDAMKRIQGITMQYDQGEARNIIIRGMAPQLNSVMINGERIPSAEGDNRNVQLDLIPSDMVQTIEVNKALTPDMDADAIGGAVNLVTRSAPSGMRISGTLASGYNDLSKQPIWTGGLVIGNRTKNDKLGYVLSASYNNHQFGSDNVEAAWVEDNTGFAFVDEFDIRTYKVQRVRRSASLNLDYKINNANTIFLTSMYNWRDDWENRYRFRASQMEDAYEDGNWAPLGDGRYQTEARIGRQTKGGIDSDRVKSQRLEEQKVASLGLKGEHLINRVKLDWSATYAKASEKRPNERYIRYRSSGFEVIQDISNPEKPNITPIIEDSWKVIEWDEITEENKDTWETDLNGRINAVFPINSDFFIKTGVRFKEKEKERNNNFSSYEPVGLGQFGEFMSEVPTSDQTRSEFFAGSQYAAGQFVDREFLSQLDLENSALFDKSDEPSEYVPNNYRAQESIYAGYAMADYQVSKKLGLIAGIRAEHTSVDYTGNSYNDDTDEVESTSGTKSYTNFLPGVHVKYNVTDNAIVRFAWTNTLARPNYFDLAPYQIIVPDDAEVSLGNPELDPTTAMNFDLMAENYFKSIGIISGGLFYKDLNDFIYPFVERRNFGNMGEVEVTQPLNGGKAKVYGFEASVQRQLDFLPGKLKGLGIYLNYTYTKSETEGIQGREDETLALSGTAENMFNASLSYQSDRLNLRVSLNHTSDYIDELGGSAFDDRYYDKQTFLDVNGSYKILNNWNLFFEATNLTNQPLRYYQGVSARTMQAEYYSYRFNAGIKFDVFKK